MRQWRRAMLCIACTMGWNGAAVGAEMAEEEELALAFGDKSFVSIATGSQLPVTRAPAVATVITAQDIQALGATDLDEVLETVPGLHVARSPVTYSPIYTIRGVRGTITNPQVLMLVNGVPVTSIYNGDRGVQWGGLPVENIARVEVIRGPGSALYGADAFAGVINIITKTADDVRGTESGVRVGSFDTADAWVLHGGRWGDAAVAGYLRVGTTDGARPAITADAQTALDAVFGAFGVPPVSLAPGPANLRVDSVDASIDVSQDRWRLRAGYKQRHDQGTGAGVAQALDPAGTNRSERFTTDLSWQDQFARHWSLTLQASFMHYHEASDLVLFPAGTNLGGGVFTDGMIGNPSKWERSGRLEAYAVYAGFSGHRLRLGAGRVKEDLYKARETKNFNPDFSPIGSGSRADVVDVTETRPFIRPQGRTVSFLVLQDEWNIAKDWNLTAGVRQDQYSDFGSTTNPRLALVWEAAYNVTAKLLYGSAFRAPAFSELHVINNPVANGNPELRPERMKTWEAAVAWQPAASVQLSANVFRYTLSELVRLDGAFRYQNLGRQTGGGLELEAGWDAGRDLRLAASYAHQHATDTTSGDAAGLSPRHQVHARADWRFTRGWLANASVNWVGEREREPLDPRPTLGSYTTVDLTVRSDRSRHAWEIAASVRNLFDADAREPSPFGQPTVPIPKDLPLAGRSFYAQATYRF